MLRQVFNIDFSQKIIDLGLDFGSDLAPKMRSKTAFCVLGCISPPRGAPGELQEALGDDFGLDFGAPRLPKRSPRGPQDAPRGPSKAPKTPQEVPQRRQELPKSGQEACKSHPIAFWKRFRRNSEVFCGFTAVISTFRGALVSHFGFFCCSLGNAWVFS